MATEELTQNISTKSNDLRNRIFFTIFILYTQIAMNINRTFSSFYFVAENTNLQHNNT